MSVENNLLTVEQFVPELVRASENIRVDGIITIFKETNRWIDRYPFHADETGLYVKGDNQKTYVQDLISTRGHPETAEAEVFAKLERWADRNNEGRAVWVSPAYPGKYPCAKVIFHQIAYDPETGEKVILNNAVLSDESDQKMLAVLHNYFPETRRLTDPEQFRNKLILPGEDFDYTGILFDLEAVREQTVSDAQLRRRAQGISTLIAAGAGPELVASEMQKLGMGQFDISCPLSFRQMIGGGDQYGSLEFNCPICKQTNRRNFGELQSHCQQCHQAIPKC